MAEADRIRSGWVRQGRAG